VLVGRVHVRTDFQYFPYFGDGACTAGFHKLRIARLDDTNDCRHNISATTRNCLERFLIIFSPSCEQRFFRATCSQIREPPPRSNRATGAQVESHLSGKRRLRFSVGCRLRTEYFAHGSVALDDDPVRLSAEAVGYRFGCDSERNLVEPFGGLELGRDDRRLVVVPSVDDREQHLRLLYGDRKQKPFVYDQEVVLDKLFSQALEGFDALGSGF